MKKTILVAGLAGALSTNAFAQTADPVETITVTGSKLNLNLQQLAGSVSVINQQQIARSGAVQITDLLRGLPGVNIAQSGSSGSLTEIRLRGSESNHLLVVIDGVIANDIGQGSLIDLAHITVGSVARIELFRGPQTALWGSGAVGGVLSITTKRDEASSVKVTTGNLATYGLTANASRSLDDAHYTVYVDALKTDGDNIARTGDEEDGYRNVTLGGKARWQVNAQHTVDAQVHWQDYRSDFDAIDYAITGLPNDANNVTNGSKVTASLRWQFSGDHYVADTRVQLHRDVNDNLESDADAGGTTGERLQFVSTHSFSVSDWQIALGTDALRRNFEQRGPVVWGDPNQQRHDTTLSVFGEVSKPLSDVLLANVSIRFDNNSEFDDATSYRAGLTWQVNEHNDVFVSHAQANKSPTFTERFGYFPQTFIGNNALVPEQSQEWELGLRSQLTDNFDASFSVYTTELEDEINGYVYDIELGNYTAKNVLGKSQRDGFEISGTLDLGALDVSAQYSYLDASQGDEQQTELRRARHQGAVTFQGTWSSAITGYLKLAYTGSRLDTFYPPYPLAAQTLSLKPYWLINANAQYALNDDWQIGVSVSNALNDDYEDVVGFAGEKRKILLSLQTQW